jgi:hypothetical protein
LVSLKDQIPFIITKPLIIIFGLLAVLLVGFFEIWLMLIFIFGIVLNLLFIKNERFYRDIGFVGLLAVYLAVFINLTLLIRINLPTQNFQELLSPGFISTITIIVIITIETFWSAKLGTLELIVVPMTSTEKIEKEKKKESKEKFKKGFKGLGKIAGKMAVDAAGEQLAEATGDLIGDKLVEITGDKLLSNVTGEFVEKGLEKITEYGIDKVAEKLSDLSKGQPIPPEISNQIQHLKIDYENRLLGILKVKKHITMEYIQTILKLPKEDIIGMIYELVGKSSIQGEFNSDDSEFRLSI